MSPLTLLCQLNQVSARIFEHCCGYGSHRDWRLSEHHPGGAKTFVFSVNIFNRERSERNTVLRQGTLERSTRRFGRGLQQWFVPTSIFWRNTCHPSRASYRDV